MKISSKEFFSFQETSNTIDGYWKTTKKGISFKIKGVLDQDHQIHLTILTQTWAQWFFSTLVAVFTCGMVKNCFKEEKKIDCVCTIDIEEVKKSILSSYHEMMALSSAAQGVNEVAARLFNRLSTNPAKIELDPLTPAQALYAEKLKKSTIEIVKNILSFFVDPRIREMSPNELKDVLDAAQEDYLPTDSRTEKFVNCMLHSINLMLNDLKGIKESFNALARVSGEVNIQNKLVQAISFGYIKKLMDEFDLENVSIVDHMIRSHLHIIS